MISGCDETCSVKMVKVNMQLAHHKERLDSHDTIIQTQGEALNKITQILAQIRWMTAGAIAFFVLNKIGLTAVLSKLIGA